MNREVIRTRTGETILFSQDMKAIVLDSFNNLIESSLPVIFKPSVVNFNCKLWAEYYKNKAVVIGDYGLKGGGICACRCFASKNTGGSLNEIKVKVTTSNSKPSLNQREVQHEIAENLDDLKKAVSSSILENIVLSINYLSETSLDDYSSPLTASLIMLECLSMESIWEQVSWSEVRKKIGTTARRLLLYSYYKATNRVQMFAETKDRVIPFANSIIDRIVEEEENFPENGLLCEIKAILAIIKVIKDSERWYKSWIKKGKNLIDIFFNKDLESIVSFTKDFADFIFTKLQHRMSIHLFCLDYISNQENDFRVEWLSKFLTEFHTSKWQILYAVINEIEPVLLSSTFSKTQKSLIFLGNQNAAGLKSLASFNSYLLSNNWRIREKVAVILVRLTQSEDLKQEAEEVIAERVVFETDLRVKDIFNDPSLVQTSQELILKTWERKKDRFERLLEQEKDILIGLEKKLADSKASEKASIMDILQNQRANFEKQVKELNFLLGKLGKTADFLEKYENYTTQVKNDILSAIQDSTARLERNFDRKFSDVMHKLSCKSPRNDTSSLFFMPNSSQQFIGREKELDTLKGLIEKFKKKVCVLAVVGMGGVGKTQLVLEFASQNRELFGSMWFINAESKSKIESGFLDIAQALSIDMEMKTNDIIRKVLMHFSKMRDLWLLVYDGVINSRDVDSFIPQGRGVILTTSRNPCWDLSITLQGFCRKESLELMKNITRLKLNKAAEILAEEMGDLPLAVCQAACYMKQTKSDFDEYLTMYKNRVSGVFEPTIISGNSLISSWKLSLEQISEESETCRLWIECLSYLSPSRIPDSLSKSIFEKIEHKDNLIKYKKHLKLALDYSLIEVDDNKNINMHKLVQNFIRKLNYQDSQCIDVLIEVFLEMFTMEHEIEFIKNIVDHLAFFVTNIKTDNPQIGELYSRLGIYYLEVLKNIEIASNYIHLALKSKVEKYGKTSLEAASMYNNLGNVFFEQNDLKQAIFYYRKALNIKKRILDPNALEVAYSYNNLGICFFQQSNMPEAVNYILKAMEIMKSYLGEDDVMITTTYMNLGMAYDEMGQYDKAEKYLQQAMDVRILKLPQKHPDIADCLLNLGILHSKTNNMKSALRETKKAYLMLEETLGNDNPTTKNAREHYQKLLKISKVSIT
ncbi:hypothetical protein SteCoe_10582 [Stentor coeruleus]|uniref:NB-ARC domain-containing protein n=1 Tax=Stentor coeruleus TaxID=5963 RepID=A0A1R2CFD6_9CILI|nr:hypothetical protein SteCoe_10582 [Stentor coeruleus]